jgi:hypothetical protein
MRELSSFGMRVDLQNCIISMKEFDTKGKLGNSAMRCVRIEK